EYSFSEKDDQTVSFAFFERGKNNRIAISPCKLANETINNTASTLLEWINDMAIPHRSLKSLVIRSNEKGDTIAALFIKDKLAFDEYPEIKESLQGFKIYYSTHKSPASRPDALLYEAGQEYLKEPIKDTPLTYGLLSFFQVNTPVFTKTIENIEKELTPETHLLDFYSGVGSIGLPLHTKYKTCTLIDSSKQAIEYAMKNIESNNIKNCEAHCVEAEKITEIITENHVLIIDPPRAGLHKDVIAKILDTPPKKIIYLSCNLTTQARDIEHLHELYTLKSITLYNYFPRTPHIEGLCILERKK
ncbi:MAG: class I SAM-dependent RNA methyltransferase, partial [Candidatus Magasanikbacteria bacterium]|nr:class I SAM-dependent RNA methyltransferase [Candidatus Magasanikbacteria bacterium]